MGCVGGVCGKVLRRFGMWGGWGGGGVGVLFFKSRMSEWGHRGAGVPFLCEPVHLKVMVPPDQPPDPSLLLLSGKGLGKEAPGEQVGDPLGRGPPLWAG